nr:hypothetical protein [Paenibacillus harenae]
MKVEESVEQIEKQVDDTFKIAINRDVHYSKSVIISAGNGAFHPRKLELEDAVRKMANEHSVSWIASYDREKEDGNEKLSLSSNPVLS